MKRKMIKKIILHELLNWHNWVLLVLSFGGLISLLLAAGEPINYMSLTQDLFRITFFMLFSFLCFYLFGKCASKWLGKVDDTFLDKLFEDE